MTGAGQMVKAAAKVVDAVAAYVEAARYAHCVSNATSGAALESPGDTARTEAHRALGRAQWQLASALGGGDIDASTRIIDQLNAADQAGMERAHQRPWEHADGNGAAGRLAGPE